MRKRLTPIVVQADQRSEEWFNARLGNVTGSNVSKTMEYYAVTKTHLNKAIEYYHLNERSYSVEWLEKMMDAYPAEFCLQAGVELIEKTERMNYRRNIVAERITGMRSDSDPYVTEDMRWGIINEFTAKNIYAERYNMSVKDAPYMMHPTLLCGASPDGLVVDKLTGEVGNAEVKCLRSANHLYKIIEADAVPNEYYDQIQMQMWITGRDWCDFIGYDSRVNEDLQLFVKRVEYDEFYVGNVMVPAITRFLDECDRDERRFYAIAKDRREKMKQELESRMAA
jgi:hypothetical protein